MRFGNNFGTSGSGTSVNGDTNYADWYYSGTGTKIAYNNGSDSLTILVGGWNLLSLSITTRSNTASNFQLLGKDSSYTPKSINGYMSELIFINKAVTTDDMIQYYKLRLF